MARRLRALAAIPALLLVTACASAGNHLTRPAPETLPSGSPLLIASLADGDAWLRHHLMLGEHARALTLLEPEGRRQPGADRLLRALQEGLVLREAGEFERSNEILEWADREAERRHIRSASETVGSLIVSDRVLSYTPTPGEAAMVPYYRMMNFLSLDDTDAAAVEARRIAVILERGGGDSRRCRGDAMLQYVSGLVFEAAGEWNDALVSLRRAEESFSRCDRDVGLPVPNGFGSDLLRVAVSLGFEDIAETARERYASAVLPPDTGTGEVVVLLERGFVAHLAEQAVHVPIFERDIDDLESGDVASIASAAAVVAARLANNFSERSFWGDAWDDHPAVQVGYALSGAYVLRLAWPELRRPERTPDSLRLLAAADTVGIVTVGDVSDVVAAELMDGQATALTRMVGRGIVKFLATREVEKKAEEKGGELLGFVTGRIANLAGNEMERADTRSWTLLPDEISMARLSLPAGTHDLRVERLSASGEVAGFLDLGTVEVRPGGLSVISRRVWSPGDFREPLSLESGTDPDPEATP